MRDVFSVVRKIVVGVSLMGFAAATLPVAHAQQNNAVRGGLAGFVTDATGAAVPNATIKLVGPQVTLNLTSDSTGHYEANGLTPGFYSLTVTAPGFTTFVSNQNEVTIDHTSSLNAKLSVGDKGTTVTVEGGVTSIDTENTSINTAITDTFYNALPLPRNVAGAFYVAPGVVDGGGTGTSNPSIGGSSGLENLYTADGVTITDQAYGGLGVWSTSYGSLGSGINLAFVKEVDVKTGAFEPKYGQADGGIVEIVTKSGSNQYHGEVAAYMTPGWGFANAKHLFQYNYLATTPASILSSPQYEGSAELGGYVPGFREKIFFFGAFDPTLNQSIRVAFPTAAFAPLGQFTYNTTGLNWAGKLTYTPTSNILLEASSYGDPSKRNANPNTLSATNVTAVSSSYRYGTRNSIARINAAITPRISFFGAYSYNDSRLSEAPKANTYSISDRVAQSFATPGPIVPYGFGQFYDTQDHSWQLQGEATARAKFFGEHTISIGYLFNHVDYDSAHFYSGPGYTIASTNIQGIPLTTLYPTLGSLPPAIGKLTTATFNMFGTDAGCTYCATYRGKPTYFQQIRGAYAGAIVKTDARYKAAYGEDSYQVNRYINLNLGLRWEYQTFAGPTLTYNWKDNWSPRLGLSVDPFGDRKSKISFSYSRFQIPLPLDAAVRVLGNEEDVATFFYAPIHDASGNAILDSTGAPVPDTSKPLNGTQMNTAGNVFKVPSFTSSAGSVNFEPGTKMEYTDEYVLGVEREIKPGMTLRARYTDRRLLRLVEDIQPNSIEGSLVDGGYFDGIANPSASADYSVNEKEVTYTPAQFAAANLGLNPGQVKTAGSASYHAPAPGCTFDNDTSVQNGAFFPHFDGTPYNGACVTNAAVAGSPGPDGTPDGFANGRRHYQALELELVRGLRNHWQARMNYRYGKLSGNYTGLFRNDNGQADPGISSLFDFTLGALGLLGDQYTRGYLNTDRRSVANALVSYSVDHSTPYIGRLNGLTVGTWLHVASGTPISAFSSQPSYNTPGEIPQGQRGNHGRTPLTGALDLHAEQTIHLGDKFVIRGAWDGFNVFDAQNVSTYNQNLDTSLGVANLDYNKPTAFQLPFSTRFKLAVEF
jgi:hypothetical protein